MSIKNILLAVLFGLLLLSPVLFIFTMSHASYKKSFDLKDLPCYPGYRLFEYRDKDTMVVTCEDNSRKNWDETWVKQGTIWIMVESKETNLE